MTSKQRANLRALASKEEPVFQIGKDNLSENVISAVLDALNKRELIKLTVLKTAELSPADVASTLAEKTGAEVIATIGSKVVLYRRSQSKTARHIELT